jgi:hypothetical protein
MRDLETNENGGVANMLSKSSAVDYEYVNEEGVTELRSLNVKIASLSKLASTSKV